MGCSYAAYGALMDEFRFFDALKKELPTIEVVCERRRIISGGNGTCDHAHELRRRAKRRGGARSKPPPVGRRRIPAHMFPVSDRACAPCWRRTLNVAS